MDQARHNRVAELFQHAVDLPPEEQSLFLRAQCGDDADLLRVVEDLLLEDRRGPIQMEHALLEFVPPGTGAQDLSGRTLSHYRILEPVGSGGMGTVYKAMDTRLERVAALKFLHPAGIDNASIRERFLREAQAVASIDHPNVCPVYEVEEAEGYTFIAMAYLKGTLLDARIARGPVAVDEAVEIAIQTARGLEAAHAKKIVHRDIKPANLMLVETESSRPLVRILDFGIAHWTGKAALTQTGLTIGTMSYMAPEQVGESKVDARADIWSLGVVLYQMLTGHLPFERDSVREMLAAIAGPQPVDLGAVSDAPAELVAILRGMLAKDPGERYASVSALVKDLEELRGGAAPLRSRQGWLQRRSGWALGLAALACVAGAALWETRWTKPPTPTAGGMKTAPFTYYPGQEFHPAISPDGKQIAFVGQGKEGTRQPELYVQLIGSTDPLRLTTASVGIEDRSPAWDPNGTRIAFLRSRKGDRFARVMVISALGGVATDLGVEGVFSTGRLAWRPDGGSVAFTALNPTGQAAIFELRLDDRSIRQRSFPAAAQRDCCPQFDPSGKRLAFRRGEVEIVVADEGNQTPRALPARASWAGLTWTANGRALVYSWFGKLMQVDYATAAVKAFPGIVATNISDAMIRGRKMAYVRWDFEHSIWNLELRRIAGGPSGPRISTGSNVRLITSTLREDSPQYSPDGQWIAFASERSGSTDIWIGSRDGSQLRRLTQFDGQSAGTPRWSPDGKWIAFDLRPPSAKPDIYVIPFEGGAARRLTKETGGADVPSWSQDGRWVYLHSRSDDQIWKAPAAGGDWVQVTKNGGFEGFESMDGKSLYYSRSGHPEIWKLDLESGKEEAIAELSQAAGNRHWALGSRGIYFVPGQEGERTDAAVQYYDFETRRTIPVSTVGRLVTAGPGALAVSRDETSLLYVHVDRDNRDIMLVENLP